MLRVFLVVTVCVVSQLAFASDYSGKEGSFGNGTEAETEHWLAQADVRDGPKPLQKTLDATRSRMLDSTGLRKALKGGSLSRGPGGKEGGAGENETSTAKRNPPPTTPVNRVKEKEARPASASAPASKSQKKKKKKDVPKVKKYNFEFSKAEIMDVVKAISNMTGKNFIVPEKLKGQRITILSPTLITEKEAYQVFLAALHVSGVTIVRSGKFLKLVSDKDAVRTTIPTCVGSETHCPEYSEQMVTRLIHLDNIEVGQINSVLKALLSKGGTLTPFQPSNALIISEYAPNLRRIMKIIKALDVPGFDDELQIVQIEYATAMEISSKLTQIFDVQGKASGKSSRSKLKSGSKKGVGDSDSGDVRISKIIPDERTNQLIIKANRRSFKAIKQLIGKLDVPISEAEQGRVHVYYLDNAKAEELASTLSSLAQGATAQSKSRGSKAKRAASANTSALLFEGDVKITADKSTNSLIIVSSAHDYRSLRKIIEKLDRARRQVYVEAAILEVTTSTSEDASLDWHTPGRFSKADIGDTLGGGNTIGFLHSGSFTPGGQGMGGLSPTLSPAGLVGMAGGSLAGIVGKSFAIPGTDVSLPSFGVLLQWLQKDSNTQVLSTPHILTMDNEEAKIEVGKKVPFQRGVSMGASSLLSSAGGGGAGGMAGLGSALGGLGGLGGFAQTDRIDVKLQLSLTPQITGNNRVRLEVDQQVEDILAGEGSAGTPTTSSQSIKSVVVMDDQQTVVLGGLMRDRIIESETKVPILGDLPLLGWFFKSKKSQVEKANLLLVLTPYIIDSTEDFQRILERKMEEHREFTASYYGHTKEYRAYVDYSKKSGPLALLGQVVMRETDKLENGGTGSRGERLITPDGSSLDDSDLTEIEGNSLSEEPSSSEALSDG